MATKSARVEVLSTEDSDMLRLVAAHSRTLQDMAKFRLVCAAWAKAVAPDRLRATQRVVVQRMVLLSEKRSLFRAGRYELKAWGADFVRMYLYREGLAPPVDTAWLVDKLVRYATTEVRAALAKFTHSPAGELKRQSYSSFMMKAAMHFGFEGRAFTAFCVRRRTDFAVIVERELQPRAH